MSDCCNEFEFVDQQNNWDMLGGIRAADGVTFYPHISAEGVLSWTNDGGKQNPDPVNIKGADGMSAYAAAQQAGFTGTEAEFNAYLSGIGELTEDVDDLKSHVTDAGEAFKTGFRALVWRKDAEKGINYQTGQEVVSNAFAHTDYILVSPYVRLQYMRVATTGDMTTGMAFYNAEYGFVSGVIGLAHQSTNQPQLSEIDVPPEAVYARFTYRKDTETYGDFSVSGMSAISALLTEERYTSWPATSSYPIGWRIGYFDRATGATNSSSTRYIRTAEHNINVLNQVKVYAKAPAGYAVSIVVYDRSGKFLRSYGNNNSTAAEATNEISGVLNEGEQIGLTVGILPSGSASQYVTQEFISQIILKFTQLACNSTIITPTYNSKRYTIACAKQINYKDNTPPKTEYYLLMDATTNKFYFTKDFSTISFALIVPFVPNNYKYAILENNDIIAVYRSEVKSSGSSDADNRRNPYVFLYAENYKTAHEVDFGTNLKPSGWLENCGFCSMPGGGALFCEYTRPSVETANCWKISGDLTNPANWIVKKSFTLSGHANEGFKHCHAVNYDFYNDVYYLCTGDDDVGAQVWYSTDDGDTWTQAREASEKYCRVLNMIFTENYIYWASDSTLIDSHYLFRCGRTNGVIDYTTISELADLYVAGVASYGLAYLREYNALVILDFCDTSRTTMPFKIYDIDANQLYTMGTLTSVTGSAAHVGFRTFYSEFNPLGNYFICGFGDNTEMANYGNSIKGCGNASGDFSARVNTLKFYIYKTSTGYKYEMATAFDIKQ